MEITEQMKALFGGSNINEANVRAFRVLILEQLRPLVEKEVRDEYVDFYTQKIEEALTVRMRMLVAKNDPEQYMKASEQFLKIMQNYFTDLAGRKAS